MKQNIFNNRYSSGYNHLIDDNNCEPLYDGTEIAETAKEYGIKIPSEFVCPISLEIMMNPIMSKYGYSYERESIIEWIGNNATDGSIANTTCPLTRQPLELSDLAPNEALEDKIRIWILSNGLLSRINNRRRRHHHNKNLSRLQIRINIIMLTVIIVIMTIFLYQPLLELQLRLQQQLRQQQQQQQQQQKQQQQQQQQEERDWERPCYKSCGPFGKCQKDLLRCNENGLCPWTCKCISEQYTGHDCNTVKCNGPFYYNLDGNNTTIDEWYNLDGNSTTINKVCYKGSTCIIDTDHTTSTMTYYKCNCEGRSGGQSCQFADYKSCEINNDISKDAYCVNGGTCVRHVSDVKDFKPCKCPEGCSGHWPCLGGDHCEEFYDWW